MSYCTQQNLIDRFGAAEIIQLTDRPDRADPLNAGSIDVSVLNQAIADADAEINAHLTSYPLPLSVVPANLVRIACDIARYYLYEDQMTDTVRQRYENALQYLQAVAAGKIPLPPDAFGTAPAATDDVDYTAAETVFGAKNLTGF